MAPIATLTVKLSAQIAEFQSEFRNATKEAQKFADNFEGIATRAAAVGTFIGGVALKIASSLASAFGQGLRDAIRLSSEFSNAFIGLGSVARAFGTDADAATAAARKLSADGLLPLKDSATGLKNLLATGFSLDQSIQLMNAFKDAAAFGRQGALSFGDAIRSATEGVKNGNSILVDNAGITKNLSQILKEAGFAAQDLSKASSDAAVRMALFNGILKEANAFTGDAQRLTQTYSGQVARLDFAYQGLLATIGTSITSNQTLARAIGFVSDALIGLNGVLVNNRTGLNLVSDAVIFVVKAFATLLNVIDLIQIGFAGLQQFSNRTFEAFLNIGVAIAKFAEQAAKLQRILDPANFQRHTAAVKEAQDAYRVLEGMAQGLRDASADAEKRSITFGNALQELRAKMTTLARELETTRGKTVEFGNSGRTAGRTFAAGIEEGSKKATAALKQIQAAIQDSLSGLKTGIPGTLPGIKVDLSKLIEFLPPKIPDIAGTIVQGFEGLKNLPGIKIDIRDILPDPPPPSFWQSTFGGVKGAAQIAANAVVDAFRRGFDTIGELAKNILTNIAGDFIDAFLSRIPVVGEFLRGLGRPIADFFGNLFDRNKGRDLIEDFIDSFGGNQAFRDALVRELGGDNAERLFAQLARVGRNNQRQAQEAIDAITAALERAEEAWGDLLGTINNRAAVLIRPLDEIQDKLKHLTPDDGGQFAQLTEQLTTSVVRLQPEFERLGQFAIAAFSGAIRHGSGVLDVLKELEPTLSILSRGVSEFGFLGSEAIDRLLGIREFVNANRDVLDALNADLQILTAFQDTGILTRDLFQSIGADIGAQFARIAENGGDMAQALALSQPVLQRLWEAQRIYGVITDDTTRAILEQAEQQGLVGAHMQDVNQKILDVLLAIADVFGAVIPEGLRRTEDAVRSTARGIREEFSRIEIAPIEIPIRFGDPGDVPDFGARIPALASGGVVRRPTLALVGESGPEAVVPLSEMESIGPAAMQATLITELDGDVLVRKLVPIIPGEVTRLGHY